MRFDIFQAPDQSGSGLVFMFWDQMPGRARVNVAVTSAGVYLCTDLTRTCGLSLRVRVNLWNCHLPYV
jgi:hypothetical protein